MDSSQIGLSSPLPGGGRLGSGWARVMDDMLQCGSCGRGVDGQARFCPFCGFALRPDEAPGHPAPNPYLVLMTANVLRLRRQWPLAEAKCSELLKVDPGNAAACSLMGDILRDQDRVPDAIEWYKMAVDRDPANETDRKKLEALIDRRFAERGQSCVLRLARSLLGRWRRGPQEEARVPRPVCPLAMVTAGVFAVTLLIAFGFVLVGKRTTRRPITPGRYAGATSEEGVLPQPRPAPPAVELTGDIASLEQAVFEQVRQAAAQLEPNCQVDGAQVDPRVALVQIQFSMPTLWAPESTRKSLVRMASALGPIAAKADPGFQTLRVRGLARHSSGRVELAMVAEGKAGAFRAVENPVMGESLEGLFQTIWWSEGLRSEERTVATGTPPPRGAVVSVAEGQ